MFLVEQLVYVHLHGQLRRAMAVAEQVRQRVAALLEPLGAIRTGGDIQEVVALPVPGMRLIFLRGNAMLSHCIKTISLPHAPRLRPGTSLRKDRR
ncbi:hypothetical protein SPH52_02185 [Halomonas sp. A29]